MCEAAGADVAALADAIGEDLRIGHASMFPGLGFGGGCLPKDIRAFGAKATDLGAGEAAELLAVVDRINTGRRSRVVDLTAAAVGGDLEGARIALWGAAFKPGTDDVRDSPALDVGVRLCRAGAEVTVFDPQAVAREPDQLAITTTLCLRFVVVVVPAGARLGPVVAPHRVDDACGSRRRGLPPRGTPTG